MAKYLVFSDLHLHNWSDFSHPDGITGNSRLTNQINAFKDMMSVARSDGRIVLFLGDLFHQRGRVATNVFNSAMDVLSSFKDVPMYAIEGNHDNVSNSINSDSSLEPFSVLPNFHLIKTYEKLNIGEDSIVFVSYGEEYSELKEFISSNSATLLLGHLGVEGSMGAGKSKLDGAFSVGDLNYSNYDLVLLGHYHKRQNLNNNSLYVGNPVSQDFGDDGQFKGYYTFDTDKGKVLEKTLKFSALDYPRFIKITEENFESTDEIEKLSENNFIRVILPENVIKKSSILDEDIPDNIRLEKKVEMTSDVRIGIDLNSDIVSIVKKWSKEFQPNNVDIITDQIKKVL